MQVFRGGDEVRLAKKTAVEALQQYKKILTAMKRSEKTVVIVIVIALSLVVVPSPLVSLSGFGHAHGSQEEGNERRYHGEKEL